MWKWKIRQESLAPTEEEIRAKAYELWRQRGLSHSDKDNWKDALKALECERSLGFRLSKRLSTHYQVRGKLSESLQKFLPTFHLFWKWTGISEKKGWDILQLLVVPVVIGLLSFGVQQYFKDKDAQQQTIDKENQEKSAYRKAEQDRRSADEKAKQETLVNYLDQMAQSLKEGLLQAKPGEKEFIIAQARTVIALQSLDAKRQHLIIQYLQAAGLNQVSGELKRNKGDRLQLGEGDRVLLYKAQIEKANLKKSDLSGANLSGARANYANFSGADLGNANLSNASLGFADLSFAGLSFADLGGANLIGTNLSKADLNSVNLNGALLVRVDLTQTEGLTQQQLEGQDPVLLCNVRLPEGITVATNRDCKKLPQALIERYPRNFKNLAAAQAFVDTISKP